MQCISFCAALTAHVIFQSPIQPPKFNQSNLPDSTTWLDTTSVARRLARPGIYRSLFPIALFSFLRHVSASLSVMPKLISVNSSPCPVRSLLHASPPPSKPSIPRANRRQIFVSSPVRPLAQPRHEVLGEPWFNQTWPSLPTRFSQSDPRASLEGLDGKPKNDHKPPDERIIKLGKSMSSVLQSMGFSSDGHD